MKYLVLLIALTCLPSTQGCAKAPPNLTPVATAAFHATKVVKALDLIRDTAIAANEQVPPVLSTATTRKVVLFHQSALKTMLAIPQGWKPAVLVLLDDLLRDGTFSDTERAQITPYVTLTKVLIAEVVR